MCSYQTIPDMYPRYLDSLVANISDDAQCQQQCTNNRPFVCRAYSFYASGSQCFISSDDRSITQITCKLVYLSYTMFFFGNLSTVSGGPAAMLSRPGTNYTERSCSKRSIDDIGSRNDTSTGMFIGGSGFGILNDFNGKPDFMTADNPIGGGTLRFPSNEGISGHGGNNRFPPMVSFGGDSIDRLPPKSNPPIRVTPSKKSNHER